MTNLKLPFGDACQTVLLPSHSKQVNIESNGQYRSPIILRDLKQTGKKYYIFLKTNNIYLLNQFQESSRYNMY